MSHSAVEDRNRQWLGSLPNGWTGGRLFQVADAWTSNIDKHTVEGEPPVRLCNYTDVYKNDAITSDLQFMAATATPEQIERFRIAVGDTLITKDSETADDIGIPAFVEYEAPDLICGYHLAIVRPRPSQIEPKFLFWTLKSDPTMGQWNVRAAGVTRVGLRSADLTKATIPLPPLDEQRRIAKFLDAETAQIDTLIAEQERFIALLHERRGAVLQLPLTSLDWRVPLRAITSLIQTGPFGSQLKSDEYEFSGVPVINPSHIVKGCIAPSPDISVSAAKAKDLRRHAFATGDVVVARRGDLGRCAVVTTSAAGYLCGTGSALVRPKPDRILPEFLALIFGSRQTRETLALESVGATMDNLNADIIGSLRFPLPSVAEQQKILTDLASQAARIDNLIAEAEHNIALSKERRAALITAAVTGQIDVSTERAA